MSLVLPAVGLDAATVTQVATTVRRDLEKVRMGEGVYFCVSLSLAAPVHHSNPFLARFTHRRRGSLPGSRHDVLRR